MVDGVGPFVSFFELTSLRSFVACFVIAVSYVASLYIYRSPYPRDHPQTIYQRFKSVLVVSLLAPFYIWFWSDNRSVKQSFNYKTHSLWKWLGIHPDNIIIAAALPLVLTIVLFLGPLVLLFISKELDIKIPGKSNCYLFRNSTNLILVPRARSSFGLSLALGNPVARSSNFDDQVVRAHALTKDR
ncbi:hypothetical protein QZH41_012586 [Actinostola sp. cb2023]|nr:hypothetical protein QZH41_012586 [Actinostola sp. cb2023]